MVSTMLEFVQAMKELQQDIKSQVYTEELKVLPRICTLPISE